MELSRSLLTVAFLLGAAWADQRADEALQACGLPTGYSPVSHCFNDVTHHTCCLLGPQARAYADNSGNPIGTAAVKAWEAKTGSAPSDSDLTPWCTCFGSLVCSYYASQFNDGTKIKFIYERGSDPPEGAFDIPSSEDCEAKARNYFQVIQHGTPGVSDAGADSSKCPGYDVAAHVKPLSSAMVGAGGEQLVHREAKEGKGWEDLSVEEHAQ